MTDMDSLIEIMAKAMKKRATEPLYNIKSLEPVLVGSLGDAWPHLIEAGLTALSEAGWMVVPREPTEAMAKAGAKERFFWNEYDSRERAVSAMFAAMVAAGRGEE